MSSHSNHKSFKSSEAYRLLHDPTRLFQLIYSKYGDIEEDYNSLYINSLLYNKSSHYLIIYKEYQYLYYKDEFLKRFYNYNEFIDRIPKLNEYYKNYYLFFCRPVFRNWKLSKIIHNYSDIKAEIYYKNNYASDQKHDNTNKKDNDNSLSSLDNMINNKTIFDKHTRLLIDSIKQYKGNYSISLDNSKLTYKSVLYSKRSINNSFDNLINGLTNTHNKVKDIKENKNTGNNNDKYKAMRIKSSLCNLTKDKIDNFNSIGNSQKVKSNFVSFKSNIVEFNKNKVKINYNNNSNSNSNSNSNFNSLRPKNKTYFYNGDTFNNIQKLSKFDSHIQNMNKNFIMIITNNNYNNINDTNTINNNNINNQYSIRNLNGFLSPKSQNSKILQFNLNNINNQLNSKTSLSKGKERNSSWTKQETKNFTSFKSPPSSIRRNITNKYIYPSSSISKISNTPSSSITKTIHWLSKNKNKENISNYNMGNCLNSKNHKNIIQSQKLSSNIIHNGIKTQTSIKQANNEFIFNLKNKINNHKNIMVSIKNIKSGKILGYNGNNIYNSYPKHSIARSVEIEENIINKGNYTKEMRSHLLSQIDELIKNKKFKYNGRVSSSRNAIINKNNTHTIQNNLKRHRKSYSELYDAIKGKTSSNNGNIRMQIGK